MSFSKPSPYTTSLSTYSLGIHLFNDFKTFEVVKTGATDNGNLDVVNCVDHCL